MTQRSNELPALELEPNRLPAVIEALDQNLNRTEPVPDVMGGYMGDPMRMAPSASRLANLAPF